MLLGLIFYMFFLYNTDRYKKIDLMLSNLRVEYLIFASKEIFSVASSVAAYKYKLRSGDQSLF